jgi:hypothetical protein
MKAHNAKLLIKYNVEKFLHENASNKTIKRPKGVKGKNAAILQA